MLSMKIGLIANNCDDDPNGLTSVGSVAYDSFVTYPYNIHLSEGIYDCNGLKSKFLPGYNQGNQTMFLHYDLSDRFSFCELQPNYSSWSGLFGDSPQRYTDFSVL